MTRECDEDQFYADRNRDAARIREQESHADDYDFSDEYGGEE